MVLRPALADPPVPQICVSRIYDNLAQPVASFAVPFRQSDLIDDDLFDRYQSELVSAGTPLGYTAGDAAFTLHEIFSAFPFSYYGRILSLVLVLCETGHEKDGLCRRGEYYITDSQIDVTRLSLILDDIIRKPDPAPVGSCDFGLGGWSDLN